MHCFALQDDIYLCILIYNNILASPSQGKINPVAVTVHGVALRAGWLKG